MLGKDGAYVRTYISLNHNDALYFLFLSPLRLLKGPLNNRWVRTTIDIQVFSSTFICSYTDILITTYCNLLHLSRSYKWQLSMFPCWYVLAFSVALTSILCHSRDCLSIRYAVCVTFSAWCYPLQSRMLSKCRHRLFTDTKYAMAGIEIRQAVIRINNSVTPRNLDLINSPIISWRVTSSVVLFLAFSN